MEIKVGQVFTLKYTNSLGLWKKVMIIEVKIKEFRYFNFYKKSEIRGINSDNESFLKCYELINSNCYINRILYGSIK